MPQALAPYLELMKPGIMAMVVVTAVLGYFFGGQGVPSVQILFILMVGTALSCAGASTLNHYLERESDAQMKRTKKRPIPSGQVSASDALAFGITLVLLGVTLLAWQINLLTGFLSLMTTFLYVLVYTPLKRVTWWNTVIGAIPGAIPPLGGWAAATGELGLGAWVLFLILFTWQHPHFYAIAWMYREDYERGGYQMLTVIDPSGRRTFRQIIGFSLLLIAVAVLPTVIGMSGTLYGIGSVALGVYVLVDGIKLSKSGSMLAARKLLFASIIYLPALLGLIILDQAIS